MAIASPKAVIIIASVLNSGLSAEAAKPALPALPIANPAARAERPKAMAADMVFKSKPSPTCKGVYACAREGEAVTIVRAINNGSKDRALFNLHTSPYFLER